MMDSDLRIDLLKGKLRQLNQKLGLALANQERLKKILTQNKNREWTQPRN